MYIDTHICLCVYVCLFIVLMFRLQIIDKDIALGEVAAIILLDYIQEVRIFLYLEAYDREFESWFLYLCVCNILKSLAKVEGA